MQVAMQWILCCCDEMIHKAFFSSYTTICLMNCASSGNSLAQHSLTLTPQFKKIRDKYVSWIYILNCDKNYITFFFFVY